MVKKMSETLSQLIRNTKEYSDVCDMCKDEILIYPIISGRTEYTQDEVEQITLKRIIDKLQAKEQECERMRYYLSKIRQNELSSLDIEWDEYITECTCTDFSNIITYVEYALGERRDD